MAAQKKRAKEPGRVPSAPSSSGAIATTRTSATVGQWDEALRLILAPISRGEGFRHGAFGCPGSGKTHAIRWVIATALRCGAADLAISHDTKGPQSEFPDGTQFRSLRDLTPARIAELDRTRHMVVRGDPLHDDEDLPVEPVARAARRLLRRLQIPILFNAGELDACLTEGGKSWSAPTVRWFSSQARRLCGSLLWTTQQPKRVPDEALDQSTTIAFHRLEVRSVNYLASTLQIDGDMVALLPYLARGEFVLWTPGYPWNRHVYLFPGNAPPPPAGELPELAAA